MNINHSPTRSGIRVLRRKFVAERCNVHLATVMRWATGTNYKHLGFPKPIQMADGSVGFYEHEVDAWLASRPRVGEAV
ncbi:MAG: helix-turn-helix transcriptional regulator [Heliomarina sp.]|uniref:helix-turn-helix transcriptional regulator n=1 Tax=Heliomarina sp. TaxID=2917556 RepID=UPI004059926C